MDGEIYFNMFREPHPIYGKSEFMIRRWTRHTIYFKSGSYARSDNPNQISILSSSLRQRKDGVTWYPVPDSPKANVYVTGSIFLYDYVVVSDTWFMQNVYATPTIDATPAPTWSYAGGGISSSVFTHYSNTWKNSPNARTNDYLLRPNPEASNWAGYDVYGPISPSVYVSPTPGYDDLMKIPIFRATDGTYFEIVRGYPRNHYTHKRGYLCLDRYMSYGRIGRQITSASYARGRQTVATTVGPTGLGDGTLPVQSTQVSNIDIVKSDNVIYQ